MISEESLDSIIDAADSDDHADVLFRFLLAATLREPNVRERVRAVDDALLPSAVRRIVSSLPRRVGRRSRIAVWRRTFVEDHDMV